MPLLIVILPHLVTFAFHKAKDKTINIPVNVASRHQIPLQSHKCTSKYILFPFLQQKLLAYLLVDINTHLLLPNHYHIPIQDFLVSNMPSDALCELFERVSKKFVCMAYLLLRKRCLGALCDCSKDALPRDIARPQPFPLRALHCIAKSLNCSNVRLDKMNGQLLSRGLIFTQQSFASRCFTNAVACRLTSSINHGSKRTFRYAASLDGPLCNTSRVYVQQVRLASYESKTTQKAQIT